jgi:hypothetical protein
MKVKITQETIKVPVTMKPLKADWGKSHEVVMKDNYH